MTNPQYFVAVPTAEQMPPDSTEQNPLSYGMTDTGCKSLFVCFNGNISAGGSTITHWLRPAPEVAAMQAQMEGMSSALKEAKNYLEWLKPSVDIECLFEHVYDIITSALEAGKIEKP